MNIPLNDSPTKYQVKVGSRIVGEALSRTAADILISQLSESEKLQASIIPITADGKQVLLG